MVFFSHTFRNGMNVFSLCSAHKGAAGATGANLSQRLVPPATPALAQSITLKTAAFPLFLSLRHR